MKKNIQYILFTLILSVLLLPSNPSSVTEVSSIEKTNQINTTQFSSLSSNRMLQMTTSSLTLDLGQQITTIDCGGILNQDISGYSLTNTSLYITNCPYSTIHDNTISSSVNPDENSYGIKLDNSPNSLIRGNTISNIYSQNRSIGILLDTSSNSIIEKNTIFNVTGSVTSYYLDLPMTNGIESRHSSNVTIDFNQIELIDGGSVNGIYSNATGDIFIDNNTIKNINGRNGITNGIIIETHDFANITSNSISNISYVNTYSNPSFHFIVSGISTASYFGNSYTVKTWCEGNIINNITVVNYANQHVDVLGISSASESDTFIQNTISNIIANRSSFTTDQGNRIFLAGILSASPSFSYTDAVFRNNMISELLIGSNVLNGSLTGIYVAMRGTSELTHNNVFAITNKAPAYGGGQTSGYYVDTVLGLLCIENSISQIVSSYTISDIRLKISEDFSPDLYSYNFEFTTNTILGVYIDQPNLSGIDSFELKRNQTTINSGPYDIYYLVNIDSAGLTPNEYNYNLTLFDSADINPSFTYFFNIKLRPSVPITLEHLTDITVEAGQSQTLSWMINTLGAINYTIILENVVYSDITNYIGISISFDLPTTLGIGNFNLTIVVSNQDITISDSINISIIDTTLPTLTQYNNMTASVDAENITINWSAFDLNPDNYSIYVNQKLVQSNNWGVGNNITLLLTNVTFEEYLVKIIVGDQSGNIISNIFTIFAKDTEFPVISSPGDIFMYQGDVGKKITWNMYDNHPESFMVADNELLRLNSSWNSEVWITFELDGLQWGFHNISLTIVDVSGNNVTDYVFVRVNLPLGTTSDTSSDGSQLFVDPRILIGGGIVIGVAGAAFVVRRRITG